VPVAVNCCVWLTAMDGNAGVTWIDTRAAVMVTEVEPVFVVSSVLVAVMETGFGVGAALGAVYKPADVIVPTVELPP